MRRLLLLAALLAGLLSAPGPSSAQLTTDQLNKLSLEALTAPPPRRTFPVPHRAVAHRSFGRSRHVAGRSDTHARLVRARSATGRPTARHHWVRHRLAAR